MDTAADHIFHANSASQALLAAMRELSEANGQTLKQFEGITLGAAFQMAFEAHGENQLPDFWRIWNEWNISLEEPPAEMGDL